MPMARVYAAVPLATAISQYTSTSSPIDSTRPVTRFAKEVKSV
jgi:hypothetical protein